MTVTAFRLHNFMAFQDSGWIELNQITLLFGRNSSGKSAIIRALRLLKQSLDTEVGYTLQLSSEDGVSMGQFSTMLHNHGNIDGFERDIYDPEWIRRQTMTFQFRCQVDRSITEPLVTKLNRELGEASLPLVSINEPSRLIDLSLEFVHQPGGKDESEMIQLIGVHIDCMWDQLLETDMTNLFSGSRAPLYESDTDWRSLKDENSRTSAPKWSKKWYWESNYQFGDHKPGDRSVWENTTVGSGRGFFPIIFDGERAIESVLLDSKTTYRTILVTLQEELSSSIRNLLNSIQYLGPLRPEPKREYLVDADEVEHWKKRGLGAFAEFLREDKGDDTRITDWIKRLNLGMGYQIDPQLELTARGFAASLLIQSSFNRFDNLSDVGSGVSQVLPIIITSHNAAANALVIIEQPELHLHPRAQADLADLFIEAQKEGPHFLIETHSETFILRLRRRLAEATLRSRNSTESQDLDDTNDNGAYIEHYHIHAEFVSSYFVDKLAARSECLPIQYDEWGKYKQIPRGFKDFFGDDFDELLALDDARMAAGENL